LRQIDEAFLHTFLHIGANNLNGMSTESSQVSLVIPLFNELEMLPFLVDEIEQFRKNRAEVTEVIFVDDGSSDGTGHKVQELTQNLAGYKLVNFPRNFGHQIAVTAGLDFVTTDASIIMDADLQDPLEVAAQMIDIWKEGYDVVYGIRSERTGESVFKKLTASLFYRFFKWITDLDIPMDTGDFRLISKPVIAAYQQVNEHQPFVRGLITWLGYNQIGVSYKRESRKAGKTKYPFRKMLKLAMNAITAFSDKPLRIAIQAGVATSVLAFAGMVWVLYGKLVLNATVAGWASTTLIVLFLGGVQMLFLGIIGIYMARIYAEVKRRPRYILKDLWTSDAD
jgi:glycosyltransferase involved in cell wall biosynthesis